MSINNLLVFCFLAAALLAGCSSEANPEEAAADPQPTSAEGKRSGLPTTIQVPSGQEVALEPGMNAEARALRPTNEDVYLLLAFPAEPDARIQTTLETEGIYLRDPLGEGVFFARITPAGMDNLESLLVDETLYAALALPAKARISPTLEDDLAGRPPDERVAVVVALFATPDERQHAQLARWLEITGEAPGPIYLVEGETTVKDLEQLLTLSLVRSVKPLRLSEPGGGAGPGG